MSLSPSYNAARFRHIERLAMQATFSQLQAMERKLQARHAAALKYRESFSSPRARLFVGRARIFPVLRLLEIVQMAIPRAAERSIHWRAVAERAGFREHRRRLGYLTGAGTLGWARGML